MTEDFVYEDAVDGRFTKAEFAVYLEELFATETTPEGFETIIDIVRDERDGEETTWGWWRTLATPAEGAGLVKARADGVYVERVAYYAGGPGLPEGRPSA